MDALGLLGCMTCITGGTVQKQEQDLQGERVSVLNEMLPGGHVERILDVHWSTKAPGALGRGGEEGWCIFNATSS